MKAFFKNTAKGYSKSEKKLKFQADGQEFAKTLR